MLRRKLFFCLHFPAWALCLFILGTVAPPPALAAGFRAGAATANITPPLGIEMKPGVTRISSASLETNAIPRMMQGFLQLLEKVK